MSKDAKADNQGWMNELIDEIEKEAKSWPEGLRFQLNKDSAEVSKQNPPTTSKDDLRRKHAASK